MYAITSRRRSSQAPRLSKNKSVFDQITEITRKYVPEEEKITEEVNESHQQLSNKNSNESNQQLKVKISTATHKSRSSSKSYRQFLGEKIGRNKRPIFQLSRY